MNILFSAVITPDNRIGEVIAHPAAPFEKISCYYAFIEMFKHQPKIMKLAKRPENEVLDILYTVLRHIEFYNETIIEQRHWEEAERLTIGIDALDISYVALALQTDAWLWTGDKKLVTHLHKMGFPRTITTGDLFEKLV
ncbi:PIN domain-containing protein [Dyadobacter sp. MSC1_007]|uniref:PIN domain-containing protein n=1 Tax=Dyadobacter sp. MSC1_007 TaxID=2909264 RepID=UPI00202E0360|nr:PIN domain-containing protein [Dyadobacter sp. MSC1_007]